MALVRNILLQSTVDGPGNRTAVFLQGCNIRCAYCHNPETQSLHDPEAREMSVEEVVAEIQRAIPFIRGVTVSGGECMLQAEWLEQLTDALQPLGLRLLIDSNGAIPFSRYPRLLEQCEGVMLDVKAWDKSVYHALTGAMDNSVVKDNIQTLLQARKLTEIRIVCLPEKQAISTDVETIIRHLAAIRELVQQAVPIRLLQFRPHGVIGTMANYPVPTPETMTRYQQLALSLGLQATIR